MAVGRSSGSQIMVSRLEWGRAVFEIRQQGSVGVKIVMGLSLLGVVVVRRCLC